MQVDFQQEKGRIQVRMQGHAGYAPAGEDIVCAAASMLGALLEDTLLRENTRGGLRALSVQKSSGVLELDFSPTLSGWSRLSPVLEAAEHGFRLLADKYPGCACLGHQLFPS